VKRLAGVALVFAAACSSPVTYVRPTTAPPVDTVSVWAPRTEILRAAKRVLATEGYQILSADDSSGVVSTALRPQRLTAEQADCGKTKGVDYLTDNRTTTRVGFNVVAGDSTLAVRAVIEGEFKPKDRDELYDISLTCVSRGALEKDVSSRILAGLQR
jgi:hypothetical protein